MMKIFLLAAILILSACTKKKIDPASVYKAEEFMTLAHETELSKEKEDQIQFSDYAPGVNKVDSRALKYQRLTFFAIAFETAEEARSEALRLNQYYSRNWLFDRVEGEPILEDYVIETFKAMNPRRKIQRVPKKHSSKAEGAHGESAHGEASGHH